MRILAAFSKKNTEAVMRSFEKLCASEEERQACWPTSGSQWQKTLHELLFYMGESDCPDMQKTCIDVFNMLRSSKAVMSSNAALVCQCTVKYMVRKVKDSSIAHRELSILVRPVMRDCQIFDPASLSLLANPHRTKHLSQQWHDLI
jgi:hypothetical protein